MKKIVCVLSLLLFSLYVFAKTVTLPSKVNDKGEIEVDNSKGKAEDRIHIENNTDSDITIVINGQHKKKGFIRVASGVVLAHDTKFLTTNFEEDLDDFKSFTISIENGKIISYAAEMAWSDLYFAVNKIDAVGTQSTTTDPAADELLKWKKLLDVGAITQDEFNAKKKQLLGL